MKITIEPSDLGDKSGYITITMDTGHNDDSTSDVLELAVKAIIAAGHSESNVRDWCAMYGEQEPI